MTLCADLAILFICLTGLMYLTVQFAIFLGWHRIPPSYDLPENELPSLSVIIAAHNEAENLRRFLPSVLNQKYPDFEVLLVLDRCTDESLEVAREWKSRFPHLRIVEINEQKPGWASKKLAISHGVGAARHDMLVFTDADCEVESNWLKEVAGHAKGRSIVLGLGYYFRYPGLLNAFIRFETLYAAFQYIGFAGLGFPYMGVGRNLAYRKSFFLEKGGFAAFREQLSGDDDLFVNAFGNKGNTGLMFVSGSRTWSEPKRTFMQWINQKVRHISASSQYNLRSRFLLGLFHLSHMGFYAGILICLFLPVSKTLVLSAYICRLMLSWLLFRLLAKKMGALPGSGIFPILDFLFFLYNLMVVPLGLIAKPRWR
jgi:cellulose synthase/poly-beta-1,6-N-acetylglucosamine synthase-like glycosyltransferase